MSMRNVHKKLDCCTNFWVINFSQFYKKFGHLFFYNFLTLHSDFAQSQLTKQSIKLSYFHLSETNFQ